MAFDNSAVPRSTGAEAPFGAGEVFYSRTDARGILLAGNEVFRRVSGYGWDRLAGAPHRIVRHPDMPRGVFRLLWERIQAGRITGAYVKNLAQDGRYYWVFAVVSPVPGGYLSVRVKPTSALFRTVAAAYDQALEREAQGADPGASAAALVQRLTALGHAGYDDFMASALAAELMAPARTAVRPAAPQLAPAAGMIESMRAVLAEKHQLLREMADIRAIPMNLHITASRIEAYGGPVATLAENYRLMAADIVQRLETIVGTGRGDGLGERMLAAAADALFRIGTAQVHAEIVAQDADPADDSAAFDRPAEVALLDRLARDHAAEAAAGLAGLGRSAASLGAWCDELKRLLLGLDSIRVLCRVEAGRLQLRGSSLDAIIGQLDGFHAGIGRRLDRIIELATAIRGAADSTVRMAEPGWAATPLRSAPRR